jgi:hypothetical protein
MNTRQFGTGKNHGNRLDAPAPTCRLTIAVGPTIKYMEVASWLHFTGILPKNVAKGANKLLQKLPTRTNLAGRRVSCSKINHGLTRQVYLAMYPKVAHALGRLHTFYPRSTNE